MASAADIARVRMLSDAPVADFDDAAIDTVIDLYPTTDDDVYDLYRAAADIVEQRAAKVITQYDTEADGASLFRSQIHAQLLRLATRLRSHGVVRIVSRENEATTAEDEEDD